MQLFVTVKLYDSFALHTFLQLETMAAALPRQPSSPLAQYC